MTAPSSRDAETREATAGSAASPRDHLLKLVTELGPLLVFFLVNARYGIFAATAAFMVAITASLVVARMTLGTIAILPLITAVFVLVFGGLTLWLQDEHFIKIKPTIVNLLFAAILLGGLALGRSWLQLVLGQSLQLDSEGWRKLTLRWGFFFALLAILNEVVWRALSTDGWVAFKTFGILPLTILFGALQVPLILRHQEPKRDGGTAP